MILGEGPAQRRLIDRVETDGLESPRIRVAFEVADAEGTTRRLEAAGATVVAEPRETPWRSRNARLEAPAGLTLTLFQELEQPEARSGQAGFGTSAARGEASAEHG